MNEKVNVYAIIVTYNGMFWYDRCLGSLRNSEIPIQVVVVDNASSDDTVEYIHANFPEVHLIQSHINLGFGLGNNKGMRYALDNGADYVFLLNQDAWIESDTIKILIEVHNKNPEYGILSPMHLNADKSAIEQGMIVFLTLPEHTPNEIISDFYLGLKKDVYDTNYVLAAAWLLPRKTIENVGGFDPLFFQYGEDDNYLGRVIYHGFKIGIVPKVTICHDARKLFIRKKNQMVTFDKWLLQRSSDLLYPDNHIDEMIKEYCKQAILKILSFHWKTFKENFRNAIFLIKNKHEIIKHREENKHKGTTWL